MKKILALLLLINLLACVAPAPKEKLKIGAIIPLSGPSSIWGESLQQGMTMALEDLQNKGISIDVIYEDSKGDGKEGLTAYNKLKNIDNVDVVFVALSRVGVPLIPLADKDKTPLFVTLAAGKDLPKSSKYVFRLFATAEQYVMPPFTLISKEKYPRIAVLYVNDEYGSSVHKAIKEQAALKGITIVAEETTPPATTDFKTELTKIKAANPDAILFALSTPIEILNFLKQARELNIDKNVFETSVMLSSKEIRGNSFAEGQEAYSNTFSFDLQETGKDVFERYKNKYGKDPFFGVSFGYDFITLVGETTKGKSMNGDELVKKIVELKTFETLNGPVTITPDGEINPQLYLVKVTSEGIQKV